MDRDAMDAEREAGSDLREGGIGTRTACKAVGDDADEVAPLDLAVGEIEDVANDAPDRRAYGVQDAQRLGRGGHVQKTSVCARLREIR